jgi:hypothetical protein
MFAPAEFFLHYFDRASDHGPLHLHDASIEGMFVHCCEKEECPFAPDVRSLDRRTILQNSQQRKNAAVREVRMLQDGGRFTHHRTKRGLYGLEVRADPPARRRLQSAQQQIVVHPIPLSFYHF